MDGCKILHGGDLIENGNFVQGKLVMHGPKMYGDNRNENVNNNHNKYHNIIRGNNKSGRNTKSNNNGSE